jgi:hypothetical protein
MACVKPEPLYLVVYMHIPLVAFPKPDKRLWRTREGQSWSGFGISISRLRRAGGSNKTEKGVSLVEGVDKGGRSGGVRASLGVLNKARGISACETDVWFFLKGLKSVPQRLKPCPSYGDALPFGFLADAPEPAVCAECAIAGLEPDVILNDLWPDLRSCLDTKPSLQQRPVKPFS